MTPMCDGLTLRVNRCQFVRVSPKSISVQLNLDAQNVKALQGGVCVSGLLGKPSWDRIDTRVSKFYWTVALGEIMT